jgi:hypothetical protein
MSSTTIKSLRQREKINNDIVIQITKSQLIKFSAFLFLLAFIVIDFLAITSNSPLLTELIIAQAIVALIAFVKFSKSNTIIKK